MTATPRNRVPSAGPPPPLTLDASPEMEAGPCVALEVRDDGCGIPPEAVPHIFEPFFTTKFTGRGLGLAAALGIVRGHRGGIEVETAPGLGSTFTLALPERAPKDEQAKAAAPRLLGPKSTAAEAQRRGSPYLLIVEDDPMGM